MKKKVYDFEVESCKLFWKGGEGVCLLCIFFLDLFLIKFLVEIKLVGEIGWIYKKINGCLL